MQTGVDETAQPGVMTPSMNTEKKQGTGVKSILWFIILTFGVTYCAEYALIGGGLRFDDIAGQSAPALWLIAIMWIPGLAGLLVTRFVEKKTLGELKDALLLRIGSVGPYFLTFILVPLIFCAIYLITWALGWCDFDLAMTTLTELTGEKVSKNTLLEIILPLSIFVGPIINFLFGLGEEIGWRGFLLPRLMVLGKPGAYISLGLLWGLWHAPLINAGFNYPGYPVSGIAMMCALTFAFGFFLNELTLHYRSSLLAGFIHGAVNAQGYGIWAWVFPGADPMLGGATGAVAVAVWLGVSLMTIGILSWLRK